MYKNILSFLCDEPENLNFNNADMNMINQLYNRGGQAYRTPALTETEVSMETASFAQSGNSAAFENPQGDENYFVW